MRKSKKLLLQFKKISALRILQFYLVSKRENSPSSLAICWQTKSSRRSDSSYSPPLFPYANTGRPHGIKWVTATVRLMRHLFAIIGARERANRGRGAHVRASARNSARCELGGTVVVVRDRDLEGFRSLRRGFNERTRSNDGS